LVRTSATRRRMVETVLAMIARRCEIGTTVALPVDVGRRAAVSSRQSNQTASPARRPQLFLRISIAVDGSAAEVSISAAAAAATTSHARRPDGDRCVGVARGT